MIYTDASDNGWRGCARRPGTEHYEFETSGFFNLTDQANDITRKEPSAVLLTVKAFIQFRNVDEKATRSTLLLRIDNQGALWMLKR